MKRNSIIKFKCCISNFIVYRLWYKTTEYNPSADNVQTLRDFKDLKLNVSNFTSTNKGESSVLCRLVETVSTPKGEPFSTYIENALFK